MGSVPMTMRETTKALTSIADTLEACVGMGIDLKVSPALLLAAQRLVEAVAAYPAAGISASAVIPFRKLPISQAVLQLIQPDEAVDAGELRRRLKNAGLHPKTSAISVALHRAVQRGLLERAAVGQYRQPTKAQAGGPPVGERQEMPRHDAATALAPVPAEAAM